MSLRDRILAAKDLKIESEFVPEWGETVYIRMLNVEERLAHERWVRSQPEDSDEMVVRLLWLTAADENGDWVFRESDVKELLKKNPDVIIRLGRLAAKVNRLSETEVTAAKGES